MSKSTVISSLWYIRKRTWSTNRRKNIQCGKSNHNRLYILLQFKIIYQTTTAITSVLSNIVLMTILLIYYTGSSRGNDEVIKAYHSKTVKMRRKNVSFGYAQLMVGSERRWDAFVGWPIETTCAHGWPSDFPSVAVSSICAAPFSNMCSTQADNNSRKLRLRCGCQFPSCVLK
jgi:hypothetical protein